MNKLYIRAGNEKTCDDVASMEPPPYHFETEEEFKQRIADQQKFYEEYPERRDTDAYKIINIHGNTALLLVEAGEGGSVLTLIIFDPKKNGPYATYEFTLEVDMSREQAPKVLENDPSPSPNLRKDTHNFFEVINSIQFGHVGEE